MTAPRPVGTTDPKAPRAPSTLHSHAMDNLRFIRKTMESSSSFTAVPGLGGVLMGAVGLAAATVSVLPAFRAHWLLVWLVAASFALSIGSFALARKSAEAGVQVLRGAGRRFLFCLVPPLAAAAVLTAVLVRDGRLDTIPATWLLLYGVAVVTAGVVSVPIVPVMGLCFMALGVVAFLVPFSWTPLLLGAGFGGLHVAFGVVIARRHGG